MSHAAWLAAAVRLIQLGLFIHLAVMPLVWLNTASVVFYLLMGSWLMHPRWAGPAQMAVVGELLLHAALSVAWVGWDSGFQYGAFLAPQVLAMSAWLGTRQKVMAALAAMMIYPALDVLTRHAAPQYELPGTMLDALRLLNSLCAMGVLVAVYFRLVLRTEARLRDLAAGDPLTGLLNRQGLLAQSRAFGPGSQGMSMLVVDIDHFKQVNDRHGTETGDAALRLVAQALRGGLRQGDLLARWDGAQFLALLPGLDVNAARMVGERLRALVQACNVRALGSGELLTLSVSLGVGFVEVGESFEASLTRADAALIGAKRAGRNRVHLAKA